jgi:neutral ceramidase
MLKAGTGRVDISPRKSMFLWGYPHVERMSTGIHDPLYATALCLDDGENQTISISVDVLYVDSEMVAECRRRIGACVGVPLECIMISATHTHSGPVTCNVLAMTGDPAVPEPDSNYRELLIQGIAGAAGAAARSLEPVEMAVTSALVDGVGCNRISPDAPYDLEAGIVTVRRVTDSTMMAVQIFYGMHPTVMHEDSTLVSSDFPAYTRKHIQEELPGVQVVYHNGPCGNLSPRYHVKEQTFAEAERLGRRLGCCITDAIEGLSDTDFSCELTVRGVHACTHLPARRFASVEKAEKELLAAREDYACLKREKAGHGPVRTAECVVFGAEEVVTMAKAQESGALAPVQESHAFAEVQVLQAGELFLVGLPCECFVEYGLEIKQRTTAQVFVASMTNGETQGYITTPDAVGYEANLSMFESESGARLVNEALRLIETLRI